MLPLPRAIDSFDGEGFFPSSAQQLGVEIPQYFFPQSYLHDGRKRFRPCVRGGERVRRRTVCCFTFRLQVSTRWPVARRGGEEEKEKEEEEKERKKVLSSRGMRRWHSCFCCRMLPENEGDRFTTGKVKKHSESDPCRNSQVRSA